MTRKRAKQTYGGDGPELRPAVGKIVTRWTIFLQVLRKCEGTALAIKNWRVALFVRIYQTFACVIQSYKTVVLKFVCFGQQTQAVNSRNAGKR